MESSSSSSTVTKIYETKSAKEHMRSRAMWGGTTKIYDVPVIDFGTGAVSKVTTSDKFLKLFDELIVNALDHMIRCSGTPMPVRCIKMHYDVVSGQFSVSNDGSGIHIYRMNKDGKDIGWSAEVIMTREFSGSNFDDETNKDSITGGVNGVGAKLSAFNSKYFRIQTLDCISGQNYSQEFRRGTDEVDDPVIKAYAGKAPQTRITFIPDHSYCLELPHTAEFGAEVLSWIRMRAYQISAFTHEIAYYTSGLDRKLLNPVRVEVNDVVCDGTRISKNLGRSARCELGSGAARYPWAIHVIEKTDALKGMDSMAIINGVVVREGNLFKFLWKILEVAINPFAVETFKELKKEYKPAKGQTILQSGLILLSFRHIPVKQFFSSQSKTGGTLSKTELAAWKAEYSFTPECAADIWEIVRPLFEEQAGKRERIAKITPMHIRKYKPAELSTSRSYAERLSCALVIPEGDSAEQMINNVISDKSHGKKYTRLGTYNIQGVPPNALRLVEWRASATNPDVRRRIIDKRLLENIAFRGLMHAIGLNFDHTYENDKEYRQLHYGSIIGAVDQDHDGVGHIFSLICVFIMTFWPALVRRGFIRRFITPLVRVYYGNVAREFTNELEFDRWYADQRASLPRGHEVLYYKGLSAHTEEECHNMAETFDSRVFTYLLDEDALTAMSDYYSEDSSVRKNILRTPVTVVYDPVLYARREIRLSEHFHIETKNHQLESIARKLPSAIDGLIPTQRKLLAGVISMRSAKEIPVYQISAGIAKDYHYHQGDKSLNDTLIKMGQYFPGACNLPLVLGVSIGFGDQYYGRRVTGAPRYIKAKPNRALLDVLFPRTDDWQLEYVIDEGFECEPAFYLPIIPYSILENSTAPATGWAINSWGRSLPSVLTLVRYMISNDSPLPTAAATVGKTTPLCREGMRVLTSEKGEYSAGKYSWDAKTRTLSITQLPLKIWSYPFHHKIQGTSGDKVKFIDSKAKKEAAKRESTASAKPKKSSVPDTRKSSNIIADEDAVPGDALDSAESLAAGDRTAYIESCADYTCKAGVDIRIVLKPGAYEKIHEVYSDSTVAHVGDAIETCFSLIRSLPKDLNMIRHDRSVGTYTGYDEIISYWYTFRRDAYIRRRDREILLLEFKIIYYENVIRFLGIEETLGITKKTSDDARHKILADASFTRINDVRLFAPGRISIDALKDAIFGGSTASYGYIDKLKISQKSVEGVAKQIAELEAIRAELAALRATTYKQIWLREIDELAAVVKRAEEEGWVKKNKKLKFVTA